MNSKTIERGGTVVPISADLREIGIQINDAHSEAERSLRASVEHAIRAARLAQAYMRLARLPIQKRNAVADLPLRDALSAIRSREEKISRAKKGRTAPVRAQRALCSRPRMAGTW
jgi:hypothetical protein